MSVEQQYIDLFSQTEAMICRHSAEVLNAPRAAAFADIGKRHRCGSRGTGRDNFYFLQAYHPQAVFLMRLRTDTQRCH